MVKIAEGPVYLWRQCPSHPKLRIVEFRSGPDLDEGPSWRAVFSVLVGKKWMRALEASYGGTGGPIDISGIMGGKRTQRKQDLYDQARGIIDDLALRTDDAKEHRPESLAEILVEGLIQDYETEKEFRLILGRGGLVGICKDGSVLHWDPHPRYTNVVEFCRRLRLAGKGQKVVEWVHETLAIGDVGEQKEHPLPPLVPENERWQPPPDLPCRVCDVMIDRKHCGTAATTCRGVMCESIEQEAMHAARSMVMNSLEKPKASLYHLTPSFFGHGCQGPIGSLVRLRLELDHFEWTTTEKTSDPVDTLRLATWAFEQQHVAFMMLAEVSKVTVDARGDGQLIEVPTLKELEVLSLKFPALLEECLVAERELEEGEE